WLSQPKNKGGIEGVKYPIIADTTKTISENYGVLGGEYLSGEEDELLFEGGAPVAYRGLFLIDKSGIVRHMVINDLPLCRNLDEVLRMVEDRKSTRLNSSHVSISYAVFCLKKKKRQVVGLSQLDI